MKSPLKDVRRLLQLYSWIGIFPANINKDATRVTFKWALYLPLLAVAATMAGTAAAMFSMSSHEECTYPISMNAGKSGMTRLERVVNNLDAVFKVLFVASSLWAHHGSVQRYTGLCQMFEQEADEKADYYVSTKRILRQHLTVLFLGALSGTLLSLATIFAYDPEWKCPQSITIAFLMDLFFIYRQTPDDNTMVTCTPELDFSCFVHALYRVLTSSLDRLQSTSDVVAFCKRHKRHFRIAKAIESVFNMELFVSFTFNVLILVTSSYLSVVNFMKLYWDDALPSYTNAASSLVLGALSGKRLLDLTNLTQAVYDRFSSALDTLNLLDSPSEFSRPESSQARSMLDRAEGLPLRGYFVVNRGILLAILSQLLTYLIILIEFEMDDQEEDEISNAVSDFLNETNATGSS